jgi:hypothetical protein
MRGLAFVYDPDHYWVGRVGTAGTAETLTLTLTLALTLTLTLTPTQPCSLLDERLDVPLTLIQ